MATVRMYRGHWVADYYDVNQRRRIERPEGHFRNAREELQAAQILLADRVAEVADGLVHEGRGTFEDAATRWLKSKVRIRPSTRRSYEHLLVCCDVVLARACSFIASVASRYICVVSTDS